MTENIILSPVPDLSDLAASAVWSVRYRDPSGFDCQLSLESASGVEVLQRAQAALAKLSESGCTPNNNQFTSARDLGFADRGTTGFAEFGQSSLRSLQYLHS